MRTRSWKRAHLNALGVQCAYAIDKLYVCWISIADYYRRSNQKLRKTLHTALAIYKLTQHTQHTKRKRIMLKREKMAKFGHGESALEEWTCRRILHLYSSYIYVARSSINTRSRTSMLPSTGSQSFEHTILMSYRSADHGTVLGFEKTQALSWYLDLSPTSMDIRSQHEKCCVREDITYSSTLHFASQNILFTTVCRILSFSLCNEAICKTKVCPQQNYLYNICWRWHVNFRAYVYKSKGNGR